MKTPTSPRLIDANALMDALEKACEQSEDDDEAWVCLALKLIESAPTVETTDDVTCSAATKSAACFDGIMDKLPNTATVRKMNGRYVAYTFQSNNAYWKTPLEAITRLEASLNSK